MFVNELTSEPHEAAPYEPGPSEAVDEGGMVADPVAVVRPVSRFEREEVVADEPKEPSPNRFEREDVI